MEVMPFPQRGQIVVPFFSDIAFKELGIELTNSKKQNCLGIKPRFMILVLKNSIQLVQMIDNLGSEVSRGGVASEIHRKFGSIFSP